MNNTRDLSLSSIFNSLLFFLGKFNNEKNYFDQNKKMIESYRSKNYKSQIKINEIKKGIYVFERGHK